MDPIEEIRRIYYETRPATIARDFAKAIELLKSLPSDQERSRAAVYMEGLAEMRSEWARELRKPRRR
jgi:hypothetical protein